MSTINISRGTLRSRVVREIIGERVIDIFKSLTESEQQGEGGIFRWVTGFAARVVGFVVSIARRAIGWLLRNLWEIIVEATFSIATFDWNQTDAAINSAINQNNIQVAGALGDLLGTGSVWLVSIGIAGAAALKFPVLAGKVALALAEEGGEELRGQIVSFLTVARNAVVRNLILNGFLTLRRLRLFGLSPITERREPWTIAEAIENRVDSIDNEALRLFVDQFLESATEAILEVGYVVSYAIDDYYNASRMANESMLGENRIVKIQPDRRVENETIVIQGPQQLTKQSIQTAITTHRWVHNRDLGQLVGQPAEDWVRAGMQRRKLTIVFKSKEQPPWIGNEERCKEATYTIPDAKIGLTWHEIKAAANRWTWGKYRATATLDNGRQMAVHGATEAEAERKVRELMTLGTAELLTLSVTEEKDRHPGLRKEPTEMYPAYATLLIRRSTADRTGNTDLSGTNFRDDRIRIDLWPTSEPEDLPPLQ